MNFERALRMDMEELQGEVHMRTIAGVIDLGAESTGKISASEFNNVEKQAFIVDTSKPEFHLPATKTSICVDQRVTESDEAIQPEEHEADWQIAGGLAVTETAADLMVTKNQTVPISKLAEKNTQESITAGYGLVVHGDKHKGKGGCGAGCLLCDGSALRANAENADIVAPKVWSASKGLGLDTWIKEDDITRLIVNGKENVDNAQLLDVTAEQLIDIQVNNGAIYEEYIGDHFEKAVVLKLDKGAFAKKRFMLSHPRINGGHNSAFGAALAEYRDAVFDKVQKQGGTELEAALRVAAGLLFNVGALKGLTAEETGNGEALPVVIIA